MEGTTINYDLARSLYRNEEHRLRYGGGFVRPIIDLPVEFMGLPTVTGQDGNSEALLNECIHDYWAPVLQQAIRDAIRDSKAVVRFYRQRIDNPLFTAADRDHGCVEVVPPESVELTYDPVDKSLVLQAVVTHEIEVDERTDQEILQRKPPKQRTHTVIETVTRGSYDFFDQTTGEPLTTWSVVNVDGFVPFWQVYNEYAADLGGGQSDIEACLAFIEAFHDVLDQALTAHRQHSIPKTKINVKNVEAFIANNWPDAVDTETGKLIDGARLSWEGHEIFLFGPDEDGGFIEAKSVLGDSKTLLDFLIDCICISSETPRWALLANDAATGASASVEPFKKKIERKRTQFRELFVMLCKMALASANKVPETVSLHWQPVLLEDLVAHGQAIQQLIMAYDVAASHGWVADITIVKKLAAIIPEMNAPEVEMKLALDNKEVAAPAAPASSTQALPPPAPAANGNGSGSRAAAAGVVKNALATTAPSRS